MKKVSLTEQLKAAQKALSEQQVMFRHDYKKLLLHNVELGVQNNSQNTHIVTQKKQLEELDAIYKRTMALAEQLALEKDALANANAKLVFMLDEVRVGYNKLVASR